MPIDPLKEDIVNLGDAAQFFPRSARGKKPHKSQLYRYTDPGLNGVALEWIQCGPTRCTSRQAIARFFDALTLAARGQAAGATSPRRERKREISEVERKLDDAGI